MNAIELLKQQHEKVTAAPTKMSEGAPASSNELRAVADDAAPTRPALE